jgi:hypothetical protein
MPRSPQKRDISPQQKVADALYLTQRTVGDRLLRGVVGAAARGFGLHRHTVSKVWRLRNNLAELLQGRQQRPPPPRRLTDTEVVERVRNVPLCQRLCLRSVSAATFNPNTTLLRYLRRSVIQRKISRVRPTLTPDHEARRLSWALSHVDRPVGMYAIELYVGSLYNILVFLY